MLERAGYDVIEAPDGHEALARFAAAPRAVDLLVTDMVMPGLHGRDLIARIRALRPDLPIVCITGYAGDAHGVADLVPHVAAVVTKPFSTDVLLRSVSGALGLS
jgi:CheY-like chemotaxis protein